MPRVLKTFEGGAERFFYKGENDRWRGVLSEDDLALYEAQGEGELVACVRRVADTRPCRYCVIRATRPIRRPASVGQPIH